MAGRTARKNTNGRQKGGDHEIAKKGVLGNAGVTISLHIHMMYVCTNNQGPIS